MTDLPNVLELISVTKKFGPLVACDEVEFAVPEGEIVGLLGQNGAGKSTLMNIVMGLHQPDSGQIFVQGKEVKIRSPKHAADLGVAMVHQHFSVIDALTVWESVCLGDKLVRKRYDPKTVIEEVFSLAEKYGLEVDPHSRISELTPGQRQRVEILKCLRRDPRVLILDEPTSVLTDEESVKFFDVVQRVVEDEGRAAVLISHKLDEILYATKKVVIMRDGLVIERFETEKAEAGLLAEAMVGRKVSLRSRGSAFGIKENLENETVEEVSDVNEIEERSSGTKDYAHPVLTIENVSCTDITGRQLNSFDLNVDAGEVVGITGAEGNGQSVLADILSSLLKVNSGKIYLDGELVLTGIPGVMSEAGIAVIPEDRHESGCALDLTVAENLILNRLDKLSSWGIISKEKRDPYVSELIQKYDVKAFSSGQLFRNLSGGNQQKCVVARELAADPKVLVAVQPTRGLDVGAIEFMVEQIKFAANSGLAVLLISTEIGEVLELSDRLVVMHRGHNQLELSRKDFDIESIGMAMAGESV
ncbi:MAG: ABC transporter ATP-binding protein [Acidimicrobiales bacterium]|nr:ABC transporter ATP-binding protein [Acidimicrobiales bacterium]